MERLEAFETMLSDVLEHAEAEQAQMERLKAAGKEKTATYRQLLGNRLMYGTILSLYRSYGLLEEPEESPPVRSQ